MDSDKHPTDEELAALQRSLASTPSTDCKPVRGQFEVASEACHCPSCGGESRRVCIGDRLMAPLVCEACQRREADVRQKRQAESAERERREAAERRGRDRRDRETDIADPDTQTGLGIPPQYHGATLTESPQGAWILPWLRSRMRGMLILTGPAGDGKTRAVYAAQRWAHVEGVAFEKHRAPRLAKHLQALGVDPQAEEAEIDRLAGFDGILALDDLGTEKVTDFVRQDFYCVLSEREEWDRPTIVTTNMGLDELAAHFDDRIASRLAGGTVLQFADEDYRLTRRGD